MHLLTHSQKIDVNTITKAVKASQTRQRLVSTDLSATVIHAYDVRYPPLFSSTLEFPNIIFIFRLQKLEAVTNSP